MKNFVPAIVLFGATYGACATEAVSGVTKYDQATLKAQNLASLSDLLVNYLNNNNLTQNSFNTIKFLANGHPTKMNSAQKESYFKASEAVELLLHDNVLVVNVIGQPEPKE
ncbi:hypothetical protein [Paraferrimonas sedimenticola]|uniref:Uncharacterized protein n=1 Tax=Paraferrimonas sedimenticola TaxID=375674 RepID=A0AA37W2R7_9GAMM|nr:hypothetical protein [Paraferrimonas sedimenticola]GLP98038.1 hypothetical protein GCM10007895_33450 [Paraferrimonas sedimenticola]